MGEHTVRTIGGVAIDEEAVTRSQRPLVAALALSRDAGATVDGLIDAVWLASAPRSARQSIQNQVARLRQSFGADLIATSADRYLLLCPTDVDTVDRVMHLCDRQLLTSAEAQAIAGVLAAWHGEPYADLPDHPAAQAERARLHLAQSRLIETLALHRLTGPWGDHHAAIVDLTLRTATDPLHEQAWELLVVALQLVGRRTEALGTYARFTDVLAQQVCAAPSRRFQQIHAMVKADDTIDARSVFSRVGAVAPIPLLATA